MRFLTSLLLLVIALGAFRKNTDTRYFELRVYSAHPGQLDHLVAAFDKQTIPLFKKHGIEIIGYWLPTNNNQHSVYAILAYPGKAAREASWKALLADPAGKPIVGRTELQGTLVSQISSVVMAAADISPVIKPSSAGTDRVFELRTYHCFPGKLTNLVTRFRNHTRGLFELHNMQNLAYWTTDAGEKMQPHLVYLLGYPSEEAGRKAWIDFRNDPNWIQVKADSERDGKIVDSVESVFLKPLAFSPIK